jgi:hypothetical protein
MMSGSYTLASSRAQALPLEGGAVQWPALGAVQWPALGAVFPGAPSPRRDPTFAATVERRAAADGAVRLEVSGKVEEELSALGPEDRAGFAHELGIDRTGLDRLIEATYRMLGLVTFYTAATDLQARTVPAGTRAHVSAGRTHTDFQRGFIRAEVIAFDDLVKAGSEHNAREHGQLRTEGRDYVVRDGDVIRFLFNVQVRLRYPSPQSLEQVGFRSAPHRDQAEGAVKKLPAPERPAPVLGEPGQRGVARDLRVMASHSFPCCLPVRGCIDSRGHEPLGPGRYAALHPLDTDPRGVERLVDHLPGR